jgi:general secretion pathway protein J
MSNLRSQHGFTLLEILIAVAIFALVSTATFSMMQQTIKASDVFNSKSDDLVTLQRAHRLLHNDFSQVIARPIRDQYGDKQPAVISEVESWGTAIELTRTGRVNPLLKARSDLLRVRYFFDGERIIRRTWKHADRAPEAEYLDQVVLDKITSWQIRFLSNNEWLEAWPDVSGSTTVLPGAFDVRFTIADRGEFRWLFDVFSQGKP